MGIAHCCLRSARERLLNKLWCLTGEKGRWLIVQLDVPADESGRETGADDLARVQDLQRGSAVPRGLHGGRTDRCDMCESSVPAVPVRLQQNRSDLDRGGGPDSEATEQRRRQLQHEAQPGLPAGGAVGVPEPDSRLHQEAGSAARFQRRPHPQEGRHRRTRLPRHPQEPLCHFQIRPRLGHIY